MRWHAPQHQRPPSVTSKSIGTQHLCTTASTGKSLLFCLLRTVTKVPSYILTLLHYQLDIYEPNVLALGRALGKNSFWGIFIFWVIYMYDVFWSLPLQVGERAFDLQWQYLMMLANSRPTSVKGWGKWLVWPLLPDRSTLTVQLAKPQLTHRWSRPWHATARGDTASHQSPPWRVLSYSTEKLTQQQNKYELKSAWIEINQS